RHRRTSRHCVYDSAWRMRLIFRRQRLQRANARLCSRPRPRRPRRCLQLAAGRGCRRRAAGGRAARKPRASCREPAHGHHPRHSVVLRPGGLLALNRLSACLALLFTAGFFELAFNAMAQTLVQLNAPTEIRGRVIGLYNMASLGLRAFSGVTVGLIGSLVGVHWSLALSALVVLAIAS